jgi:putative transposase
MYRDLLAQACRQAGVEVYAWMLMPNPVHLVLAPSDQDGCAALWRRCIGAMPATSMRRSGVGATFGRVGSARWYG